MTDNFNECAATSVRTHAQLRRKVREQFKSEQTREALSEAILSVPGITALDEHRISNQLAARLDDYLDDSNFKVFRQRAAKWCKRQAELTAIFRENEIDLRKTVLAVDGISSDGAHRALTVLLDHLPSYTGTIDSPEFVSWVTPLAVELARQAMTMWVRFKKAEPALYAGIWWVFRSLKTECMDFDTPVGMEDIAESLAFDVMVYFMRHYYEFPSDGIDLNRQLCVRGKYAALKWRKQFLSELDNGIRRKPAPLDPEYAEKLNIERATGRDQSLSRAYPIRLGPSDKARKGSLAADDLDLEEFDIPIDHIGPKKDEPDSSSGDVQADNEAESENDDGLPPDLCDELETLLGRKLFAIAA